MTFYKWGNPITIAVINLRSSRLHRSALAGPPSPRAPASRRPGRSWGELQQCKACCSTSVTQTMENHGKPSFFVHKLTIAMASFNSKLLGYQKVSHKNVGLSNTNPLVCSNQEFIHEKKNSLIKRM